jgi:hypothetical protein
MSRRPRKVAALATLVMALGGGSAYAAWSATTSPPPASFSGAPDWTPPAVTAAAIKKSTSGYSAGYVRPGGQYYVYAQVATDTGNPPSGLAGVTSNLTGLTSGQSAAALSAGTYSVEGVTYKYRAGPFTVSAAAGNTTYSVSARDVAANVFTTTSQPVVVDGTAPTGSDVQTTNVSGGTAGSAEAGDTLTLTFSEPIDPNALVGGWDGTARAATLELANGGGSAPDTVQLFNGTSPITALGTIRLPDKGYVKAIVDFTNSTMVLSGSTLTVTLGSTNGAKNVSTGGSGTTQWVPTASLYDRAGNALTSTTVNGSGSNAAF